MATHSKIEWTDHTFNPWVGCTKVGPGCDHCYAEGWAKRAGKAAGVEWGGDRRRTSAANWQQPLRWNAQAQREGRRFRVFCASLADVFDNQVPPEWRADLFRLIERTPHLDWLLLTKRIGNAAALMFEARGGHLPLLPQVWIGATVVNQAEANRDIPKLLAVPARVRFLSIEPMLGPIDLSRWLVRCDHGSRPGPGCVGGVMCGECGGNGHGCTRVHWVICGGESGPNARPMHLSWPISLRDQCAAAGVPFLFKQWGEWCPRGPESQGYPVIDSVPRLRMTDRGEDGRNLAARGGNDVWMNRAGKKAAGRLLQGRTHDEFPEVAR